MEKLSIAVMFGGKSLEHEISIISALQAMMALDSEKYQVTPLYIDLNGRWYTGDLLFDRTIYPRFSHFQTRVEEVKGLFDPAMEKIDVFFLCFHGQGGEDGCVQGMLEMAGKVYTGGGVLPMALSMNKYVFKKFLQGLDVPVVPGKRVTQKDFDRLSLDDLVNFIVETPGLEKYPLFVKPNNLGSSVGVSRAKNADELVRGVVKALQFDQEVLIEKCVASLMEINVAVRTNSEGKMETSVVEIPVASKETLTYEDKYLRDGGKKSGASSGGMASLARTIDPQDLDVELKKAVYHLSKKVYLEMNLAGVVRFDFMVDLSTMRLYLNELNAIPGSLSFYLWESGKNPLLYSDVLDDLIEEARRNWAMRLRVKNQFGFKALK